MKYRMTIEYLKCGADLKLEVDFRVNGVLVRLRPSGNSFYSENGLFLCIIYIILNRVNMPLKQYYEWIRLPIVSAIWDNF